NRLWLFGGEIAGSGLTDTWSLALDQATPALVSIVSAVARAASVVLEWQISADDGRPVTVYRHTETSQWKVMGQLTPDGTGRLHFEDRDVGSGGRYGYRLGLSHGTAEVFAGELWIDVPAVEKISLGGSNPATHGLVVSLSLPDAMPAALDLYDVSGRRMLHRDLGGLGPGEHLLDLSKLARLRPGVYLVRLTRGALTASKRVALLE
ncbi:MAG: T9SS type A sorting domain-containing protein, partial [Candidatus Eisenbacteria bacterium]